MKMSNQTTREMIPVSSNLGLVDYQFLYSTLPTKPGNTVELELPTTCMYQYLVGSNGVFLRTRRSGLQACLPLALGPQPMRGLTEVDSYLHLDYPLVPPDLFSQILEAARQAKDVRESSLEILFYLVWAEEKSSWELVIPEQVQGYTSVHPANPTDSAYQQAFIEVHSHHHMKAYFSGTDDKDEGGLRFYAVIGDIFSDRPQIALRLGIYGQFFRMPATNIFDLTEVAGVAAVTDNFYALSEVNSKDAADFETEAETEVSADMYLVVLD
jgi:PRTRC genetic system protein A